MNAMKGLGRAARTHCISLSHVSTLGRNQNP